MFTMTKSSFFKFVLVLGAILIAAGLGYIGWRMSQSELLVRPPNSVNEPVTQSKTKDVTPTGSPIRNVDVMGPLSTNALPGLISGNSWDSGPISLATPVSLTGKDGVTIDVDFADTVLQMTDTTGASVESITVEVFGQVMEPDQDISGEPHDTVEVGFYFDELAVPSDAAVDLVNISSVNGTGILNQSVNFTNSEVKFGGFTVDVFQNGTGSVEITGFRVALHADAIMQGSELPP